jgi:hypothetical protein
MADGSKRARRLKKTKLARDDHALVPLGIPTALFPIPRGFDPFHSLPEARFALYKGHFARSHLWESLGRPGDRRFRPDNRGSTRNPKIGPEVKKLNQRRSYKEAFDTT